MMMIQKLTLGLQKLWYQPRIHPMLWPLLPLSFLYLTFMYIRSFCYELKLLPTKKFSTPIIIVGNITTGGSGKTPLVIHLVRLLKQHGLNPGVVSRGYLGLHDKPTFVYANSDPNIVGDEPLLLSKRLFCPIVVAKRRNDAVQALLETGQVDVIISDDGLQHLSLERDIEIIVVDGKSRFGNGWCLPAGPLREPLSRLHKVDFIISNTPERFDIDTEYDMELRPRLLYKGIRQSEHQSLYDLRDKTVHAVAGIGFPVRFFDLLTKHGLKVIAHPYPDHHRFQEQELIFEDDYPVIMTEKDAVKCEGLMDERHWVLPVEVAINPLFDVKFLTKLKEIQGG